jgi:hypothetical protein
MGEDQWQGQVREQGAYESMVIRRLSQDPGREQQERGAAMEGSGNAQQGRRAAMERRGGMRVIQGQGGAAHPGGVTDGQVGEAGVGQG